MKGLFVLAIAGMAFAGCDANKKSNNNAGSEMNGNSLKDTAAADTNVKGTGAAGAQADEMGDGSTTAPGTNGSGVGSGANGTGTGAALDTGNINETPSK
ncbi:MAG: hypothetical protein ACOH2A_12665 [Sphingobacteriaceae bacterium]